MLVFALVIIPLLVIPLVVELSSATETILVALEWFIWAAFAVEYVIRLFFAPQKWSFSKRNKIDLLVIVVGVVHGYTRRTSFPICVAELAGQGQARTRRPPPETRLPLPRLL